MSITVKIDQSALERVRAALEGIKNGYENALVTSINKTLTTAKTQAAARIGNELNLKAARIKEDFTVKKANYSDPSGALTATGEPVGLVNFGANKTQKGVTVKVKRSGSRSLLKHAFISKGSGASKAADGTTKEHVFWREYDGPRSKTPKWMSIRLKMFPYAALPKKFRLPLERLTGPRIEDIFAQAKVLDPVTIQANTLFLSNVESKIDEILRRYNG